LIVPKTAKNFTQTFTLLTGSIPYYIYNYQAQNKEVGIFPHPFRGNPDRGCKKHRIFAPEKKNMKYNNLKIYDYETNDNSSGSHVHDDIHYRFCNEL
jgi:hypothetical protein